MPKYYKAVPKQFLAGIKKEGLDPMKAGQPGGATAMAMAVGRKPTEFDTGHTWFGPKSQAITYAQDKFVGRDPVIIKIVYGNDNNGVIDKGKAGFCTTLLIPPDKIYFQTKKGHHWLPISMYDGENALIYEEDFSEDSESDDE